MENLKVGIREAKANLSKLLKIVHSGKEVVLTDRGRPVGKLVPIGKRALSLASQIKEMEDAGIIETAMKKAHRRFPPPILVEKGIAQRLLKEDRKGLS